MMKTLLYSKVCVSSTALYYVQTAHRYIYKITHITQLDQIIIINKFF